MPVVTQSRINRSDLRANPTHLFVFGDNEERIGLGGQAGACRGEPNAIGVATKRSPSMHPTAFWSDDDFNRCAAIVDEDLVPVFKHLRAGGVVVLPEAGIGTGLSELPKRAPRLAAHIATRFEELRVIGKVV